MSPFGLIHVNGERKIPRQQIKRSQLPNYGAGAAQRARVTRGLLLTTRPIFFHKKTLLIDDLSRPHCFIISLFSPIKTAPHALINFDWNDNISQVTCF